MSLDAGRTALSDEQKELLALLLAEEGLEPEAETGILRRREGGDLPLSFPQQRLWFLQQLEGGADYNVPFSVHLDGALHPAALAGALSAIVRRHESLRTSFGLAGGQPVQRIAPAAPLPLPLIDLRRLPAAVRTVEARRVGTEEIHRPFDLSQAPLVRATLVRLAGGEHILFMVVHHIASDLWSRGVLLRELGLLYRAALNGGPAPLPELPIQYADFALWQRREVERILESQLAWWRERLAGVPRLDLPTDRPRGVVQGARGRRQAVTLPRDLSTALEGLARRESKTLFMTLLAGFQALLFRLSGQEDIAVGTPVIHRKRVETEGLIGLFLNTLVLRTGLGGEPSFRALLARVHEVTVGAYAHDDLPFEKLVDELQPERDLGSTPLFQVVFSLGNAEAGRFELAGAAARPFPLEDRTAKFELNLTLGPGPAGLTGQLKHRADLFDSTTIQRLTGHFTRLLAGAVAAPEARITELPLLCAAEQQQLLREWNDTAEAYAPVGPLHRLIERQVARTPQAIALVCEEHRLSYAGLNARANRLARHLRARGAGPETVVGLCLERSLEMVVGLLAVLKAGAAYLPIDPEYPEERRAFLLADSAVPVLLTRDFPDSDLEGGNPDGEPDGDRNLDDEANLDDAAYVIYTSGSTGRPKGVQVPHRGIVNRLFWMQQTYGLAGDDRVLQKTPFSFDVSVWEFFWPLLTGAGLVVARPGGHRDPAYLVELIRREGITTLHFVPSMLRLFVEEPGIESCRSLRRVMCSGEALPFDLQQRWQERSPAGLHNLYGPTEAAVDVTFWACRGDDRPPVPIGRPVANTAIHLLDRMMRPVPIGAPGELHIGGVQLARGYLGRPALTARQFVPDPFGAPGARLYKTGDLARHRADGAIEYLGRLDHQVKVRGFRIEPGEVEAALAQHPAVAEAAVVPREDPPGHVRLAAYLVAREGRETAAPALRLFLQESLPEHMIPSFFVTLGALPLSPNGKLDRRALPAPGEDRSGGADGYAAPETPAEEVLAAIWAQVIGVGRVGIHDNFFALGGDSIRSLQVVGHARERGLALTLQQVFQFQTVAELARQAAALDRAAEEAATAPFSLLAAEDQARLPAGLEDAYPLTAMQVGMLFHMALRPDDPPYHNVDSWQLEAPFAAAPFHQAFDRVTARHAVLRTSYDLSSFSEPLQLVHPEVRLQVEVVDLRELPAVEQERVVAEWIAAEKRRLFAHGDVPQLRCRVHLRTADTFQLTLTENHAVWDGWSLHSTLAELFDLYTVLRRGEEPPPAPPIPVEFRDFVALERRSLASAEAREAWDAYLDGCEPLVLPAWPLPDTPPPGRRIRVVRHLLPDAVAAGLRHLALVAAVPLKSVFLAAHLRALSLAGGRQDVLSGIISNGRPEVPGGDQVRGLFLNTLPIRLRIEPGSWASLVRETFATERRILPFRRYPLIALQRDRGGDPLFEAVFNYIHFYVVDRAVEAGGIRALSYQGAEGTSFLLEAHFFPAGPGGRMTVDLEYDSHRLPVEQAEALGRFYRAVLEAMAADPEAPHSELLPGSGLEIPPPAAVARTARRKRPGALVQQARTGAADAAFIAPRTPEEETLAAVWREVLRRERIGVCDDFFALGGDSILAIRIVARAARAGLRIDPREIFARPTIAGLATVAAWEARPDEPDLPAPSAPEDGAPLTPLQEGMLLYHLLNPGSGAYFGQAVIPLAQGSDPVRMRRAWELLVERHAILRTRFLWQEREMPRQVVEPSVELPWREEDWRGVPEPERPARLSGLLAGERRTLDLSRAPVLRFVLLRTGEAAWQLARTWHHIVLDGWSLDLLAREEEELVRRLARGGEPALPPAVPFRAYLDWLARQPAEEAERFWRSRLAGFTRPTPLPAETSPAAETPTGAERRRSDLGAGETAALQAFARRHGLTSGTLVAGAWAALLGRCCDEEEVVFGLVSSGRPAELPGVESIAGVFLATPPVRVSLPAAARVLPWLAGLQADLQEIRRYEHLPLPAIQRCSPVPASRPLFESLVVVQPQREEAGAADPGRVVRSRDPEAYALSLFAVPGPRLSLRCAYDPRRFEGPAIARLLGHLETVLISLAEGPDQPLGELPLLTPGETQQLLHEWNPEPAGEPAGATFPDRFAAQAARTPQAPAAACGGEQLTYRELDLASGRRARRLREEGVEAGDLVALLGPRGLDLLVGILAVLRAGAAYLPLDPSHPPRRWSRMLAESGARLALAGEAQAAALADAVRSLPEGPSPRIAPLAAPADGPAGVPRALPGGLAYVIYTSGSTGIPKGAMIEHRGLLNHLNAKIAELGLTADDAVAQTASQCFDISLWQLLAALLVGGRVEILADETVHDPSRLARAVSTQGITILETVPSLLRLFLDEAQEVSLASLRCLIPTGEALPPDLCRHWLERFPEIPLLNAYGPTECSDDVSHQRIAAPPMAGMARVPIGRPLPGLRLHVLDRRMRLLPAGVAGELCIGGVGVGRGYLGDPARTAERFVPDPFSPRPGGRLYRTGDRALHLPGGELDFLGRFDHQVKLHGYRIELGEIEAVLRRHPGVSAAAVLLCEDRPGDARLVAYVVPSAGTAPADGELRERLREQLPEPMVPSVFVLLAAMPLTPNGKLDRAALPAPATAEAPGRHVAPRTLAEEMVAGIWAEVLGLGEVAAEDDFFALGGHSLRAIQVASRIRRTFGLEIPLIRLFENTTVATLAAAIEGELANAAGRVQPPTLLPCSRERPLPLSFSQRRQWFLDQLEPGNPAYNMPASVRLGAHTELPALVRALGEILRRHEILRTTFQAVDGEPSQIISPLLLFALPSVDLRGLEPAAGEREARRLARAEGMRPFDLAAGPLLRPRLLLLPSLRTLLFPMHHIVSDGWSMGVFLRELSALYEAFAAGRTSPLPELPVQYADYAVWQQEWLQGEVLEGELAFWRRQLAGAPPRIDLPTDRPRPPLQTFRGARRPVPLPAGVAGRLVAFSRRQGVTPFMSFLGALGVLLHRQSGATDISIGTYTAGRNLPELEGLIGFFVNTLVLRNRLAPDQTLGACLERVREVTLGAFGHQDLPFEKLLEELRPERNLSHTPLFQVMLELQNLEAPGSRLIPVPEDSVVLGRANFDLTLALRQNGDEVALSLGYNRDLFDGTTIMRWAGHLRTLLEAMPESAALPLSALPLFPLAERHQLVHEWSRIAGLLPESVPVHRVFAARAARAPEALAVVCAEGALSYGALDRLADRLAHRLRSLAVGPDVRVGLCLDRSPEMLIALLGILKAGGAYVPLDPAYPAERLRLLAADSRCAVLVTQERWVGRLPEGPGLVLLDDLSLLAGESGPSPEGTTEPGHLAYVIYTSGSTGTPKGVEIPHGSLAGYTALATAEMEMTTADRVLQFASLSFDTAAEEIFPALSAGATLVLRDETMLGSPALFLERCARSCITVLDLPTAYWAELAASLETGEALLPPVLRLLVIGGEKAPAAAVAAWRRTAGARPRLLDTYGPTEATIVTTVCDLSHGGEGTLGFPVRHARLSVADAALRLVPLGAAGELLIGGAGLARGYLDRPELTAERFVPDPWGEESGGRLYRSGDLVRWRAGGRLEFLGRIDRQVKVRGFRVELGEIEEALASLPEVSEAAVLAPDGEAGRRLVAWIAPRPGPAPDPAALLASLRRRLPAYLVPSALQVLPTLPRTVGGKVDRRALEALGEPGPLRPPHGTPPRSPAEEVVAAIWSDLLRLERIGVEDDFFALGGHSLLATRILSRVRQAFRVDLPARSIFEKPTVAGLVEELVRLWGAPEIVDEIARTYQEFQNLSEEEIRQLLAGSTSP